jgi:hypothetical protein
VPRTPEVLPSPASPLSWIFDFAFSLFAIPRAFGRFCFSFLSSQQLAFRSLRCRNFRGGYKGLPTDSERNIFCQPSSPGQQHTPPLYDTPSQRTSQAFLFSGICSAGMHGTGATCFFPFARGPPPRRGGPGRTKNLDWLYFQLVLGMAREDGKQDSIQPQAGATCCQDPFAAVHRISRPTDNTPFPLSRLLRTRGMGGTSRRRGACMVFG